MQLASEAIVSARWLSSHKTIHNKCSWNQKWTKRLWCGKVKMSSTGHTQEAICTNTSLPHPLTPHLLLPKGGILVNPVGHIVVFLGPISLEGQVTVSQKSQYFLSLTTWLYSVTAGAIASAYSWQAPCFLSLFVRDTRWCLSEDSLHILSFSVLDSCPATGKVNQVDLHCGLRDLEEGHKILDLWFSY